MTPMTPLPAPSHESSHDTSHASAHEPSHQPSHEPSQASSRESSREEPFNLHHSIRIFEAVDALARKRREHLQKQLQPTTESLSAKLWRESESWPEVQTWAPHDRWLAGPDWLDIWRQRCYSLRYYAQCSSKLHLRPPTLAVMLTSSEIAARDRYLHKMGIPAGERAFIRTLPGRIPILSLPAIPSETRPNGAAEQDSYGATEQDSYGDTWVTWWDSAAFWKSCNSAIYIAQGHIVELRQLPLQVWGSPLSPLIANLRALKVLSVELHPHYPLPPQIEACQELRYLAISGTNYTQLPDFLQNLSRLQYLYVPAQLFPLPKWIAEMPQLVRISTLFHPNFFQLRSLAGLPPRLLMQLFYLGVAGPVVSYFKHRGYNPLTGDDTPMLSPQGRQLVKDVAVEIRRYVWTEIETRTTALRSNPTLQLNEPHLRATLWRDLLTTTSNWDTPAKLRAFPSVQRLVTYYHDHPIDLFLRFRKGEKLEHWEVERLLWEADYELYLLIQDHLGTSHPWVAILRERFQHILTTGYEIL